MANIINAIIHLIQYPIIDLQESYLGKTVSIMLVMP